VVKRLIKNLKKYQSFFVIFAAILVSGLLIFVNVQYTKGNQGGNVFFSNWIATRDFLLEGRNPYSTQTTSQIQNAIYGRTAVAGEPEYKFSLPLYGFIIYSPFALFKDFYLARALWMTILEIGIVAILIFSIKLTFWKTSPLVFSALLLFVLFGFHSILPLMDGSVFILIALMVTGIIYAIQNKQDEVAGLLLAFITITPASVVLFFIFILTWAIINHRAKIITWFLGAFLLLIGFSIALIPNWFLQFLRNFIDSYKSIDPGSPGGVLISRWGDIGSRLSIVISVVIGLVLIFEWWQSKNPASKQFVWTAMITLGLNAWSGIKLSPVNYIILMPALILGLELLCERWKQRAYGIIVSILALLFLGNWGIYLLTMSKQLRTGISSFLIIPLPLTILFLLYWSKWWVRKSNLIEFEPTLIELQK
jgi:hypothetical protein